MRRMTDIMDLWPSLEVFAKDAGAPLGLIYVWRNRGSIPATRWAAIERGATRRGIKGVSATQFARMNERTAREAIEARDE